MNITVNRHFENILLERLKEPPSHIQVILGPRQVGKTTGTLNVLSQHFNTKEYNYLLCESALLDNDWLALNIQKSIEQKKSIIVLDEIQKVQNWSEQIKLIWDQIKLKKQKIHLVLLGSSSLQLSQGLSESLAGRFEVIRVHHWGYIESKKLAKITINEYLQYCGYPASYKFMKNEERFNNYLTESIIEAVITRDIQRYVTIKKPSLFRQTFALACQYPAQEISYNKLLGQLQEAGNVDQIKHYLELYQQAFLINLIFKWNNNTKSRTSSPKLLPCSPAFTYLFNARNLTKEELGRVFESVVGNILCQNFQNVYYWRQANYEVDYVIKYKDKIYAIEVKTKKRINSGIAEFKKINKNSLALYIDFENFENFESDPKKFIEKFSL